MEDLLTPQICMDVDDTPLDVGKDSSDDETQSEQSQPDDDYKVKKLLEFEFKDQAQVPDELTDFEKEAKKNVFSPGELAVQFHRLHCTACNIHLGSSPIGFFDRYIHPILKVLMCKGCYDFYCSGEFDKDEDGSEMYCRWCGQGGKVMCCAQCAYVFCQKCVRQNLGKKTLEIIKDSDDWLCFGCNPAQLINLKIICASLYDFMQEELRLAKALVNVERLKIDHSMCCTKVRPTAKRKREEDEAYSPRTEEIKTAKRGRMASKSKLAEALKGKPWPTQKEDGEEVVCAPDVLSLMDEDNNDSNKNTSPIVANKENNVGPPSQIIQRKLPFTSALPRPLYICSSGNVPQPNNNVTNVVRIQTPAIKLVSPTNTTSTTVPLITSIPVQLVPGLKHEWFEKAATVVSTITGNLAFTLDTLTNELKGAKTVENLATVHNKLQELLSTSINSLIQVRKSLRNQFLTDLNNLKFTADKNAANNVGSFLPKPSADDDDVIIVKSDILPKKEPIRSNGRPYLKVRTVSQLLSVPAECITIPDDPPDDPLEMDPTKSSDGGCDESKGSANVKCENKESESTEEKLGEVETSSETKRLEEKNEDRSEKLESNDDEDKKSENENSISDSGLLSTDNENLGTQTDPNKPTEVVDNEYILENIDGNEDHHLHDLSGYDKETSILIRNALIESKLDQIIDENLKCTTGYTEEELRKMLSVRVMVAPGAKPHLPKNRVVDEWCSDDIEEQLACAIVPNVFNDKRYNRETEIPANDRLVASPESGTEEKDYSGDSKNEDNEKVDYIENMDTTTENKENCDNSSEKTEEIVKSSHSGQNEANDVLDEIAECLSTNECDLSDKETDHEKTEEDADKKSLNEDKKENSENLLSDLEDNMQSNDDLRTETSNEPITDSGVEVDSK